MINADMMRFMIGCVALGFVAFQLAKGSGLLSIAKRQPRASEGIGWGAAAGFTSFISHAGGPPASIYLLSKGLDRSTYQSTTVIVFAVMNAVKFVCYLWIGMIGSSTVVAVAVLAPFAIAGTFVGVWAHRQIPESLFFAIVYVMLTITGSKLIFDALT
jgi:uncharacterized membrane protein YfcA